MLLSLMFAVVMVCAASPVIAQPKTQDDIQQRLEDIARLRAALAEREGDLRGNIAEAAEVRDALTDELSELQAIVDEVQSRVNIASAKLAAVQRRIDLKDAMIGQAEDALQERLDMLHARAVQMYKRGPASLLDFFAEVKDVGDLLRKMAVVLRITKDDNATVAEIKQTKVLLMRARDELTKLRDEAQAQRDVVAVERNRAAGVANQVASRRNEVSGKLDASYQELGDIRRQREQYDRETAQLVAESAAIAAFLRGRGDTPAQVSPKGMTWPAQGPVTSGFGWRTHPIFGTKRFHAGIDIGASSGAPIVAAGSGTVAFVGEKSGYGNATIIDHGGGIATLYAHQSSIGVSTGQVVGIGQTIGAIGCTGYCTGPHLHFEVRVNGDPVDPMGWLP